MKNPLRIDIRVSQKVEITNLRNLVRTSRASVRPRQFARRASGVRLVHNREIVEMSILPRGVEGCENITATDLEDSNSLDMMF